ncbi:MAG: DUF5666 domain-containing protein [Acidobacteriota bacterium]
MNSGSMPSSHPFLRAASCAASAVLLSIAAFMAGCSGGGSSMTTTPNPTPTPTPASSTQVQVNMGDSPADWMLAFSMNITSMSLTSSSGSTAVVSTSTPMEMMHLMGTMQPLAMISAPQGTYTGASITVGSATVMYMDPSTHQPMQKTLSGPMTASITFASPMNLASTPMAMGFDLDLAKSVTQDSNGNLVMNPVFHVTTGMQGSGNPMDFEDGGVQQMMGMVTAASGTSFTMSSMVASQSFTFAMNSSTKFSGTSMSGMASGMLVLVDAAMQSDGSLMATNVINTMGSGGLMGGGVITSITGNPPTAITMTMQNGVGSGMMSSYFASGVTINLASTTTYSMDTDQVDMSGLPFTPVFDAAHIYAGQSVMPVSSSGMMSGGSGGMGGMGGGGMMGGAGTMNATQLYLAPQGVTGTVATSVTGGGAATLTLTLPSDSAFTTLTGATTVTVYQQSKTIVTGNASIPSGSSIHAFGLLFFDGGEWKMIAQRIGLNS